MKSSFMKKYDFKKTLAAAITAGLLAGAYAPCTYAAEYSTGITGNVDTDTAYADVIQSDGSYIFGEKPVITIDSNASFGNISAITNSTDKDLIIDSENGIGINASAVSKVHGIYLNTAGKDITINGLVTINATGTGTGIMAEDAYGIKASNSANTGLNGTSDVVINGDTNITVSGNGKVYGINVAKDSKVDINGNVNIDVKSIKANNTYGIYAMASSLPSFAPEVNINGNVDINTNGTGVYAYKHGSTVNINSGSITTDKDAKDILYSLFSNEGNINLNYKDGVVEDKQVILNGNIGVQSSSKASNVNVGLNTADSVFNGIVFGTNDSENNTVNITLANGATWNNEVYGTADSSFEGSVVSNFAGGSSAETAGLINQKDSHNLTLKNYSGYTNIFYEHTGNGTATENYKGGNTVINNAAEGSSITLITGNNDVTEESVDTVLNALAGKLYYIGYIDGERNLDGKVMIADGLTASSQYMAVGDIKFNETTGQGSSDGQSNVKPEPPESQEKFNFTTAITGNKNTDEEYHMSGVIKDNEDGGIDYVFVDNSTISTENGKMIIAKENDVNILATGIDLSLNSTAENSEAIAVGEDKELAVEVNKLNVTLNGQGNQFGISSAGNTTISGNLNLDITAGDTAKGISVTDGILTVDGSTTINAIGKGAAQGIYVAGNGVANINGNLDMIGKEMGDWGIGSNTNSYYKNSALYAGANYNIDKGGKINVNGNVNLHVNGNGAFANGHGSEINLTGGRIEINPEEQYYALLAQSGSIYMNVTKNEEGKVTGAAGNVVNILGNIGTLNGSVNKAETEKDSRIELGLSTSGSSFKGVIDNNFTPEDLEAGYTTTTNIYLSNGANWSNERYGVVSENYSGSHVTNLVGGKNVVQAGDIFQKDDKNLTIDNYSGYTNIFYAHDGNGEAASDFKAGDTHIKHAAEGSNVNLITSSFGVNMKSDEAVNKVLNNLAGKLFYEGAIDDKEANLSGKVIIADGLTSSSITKAVGDLKFSTENGQGSSVNGQVAPDGQTDYTEFKTGITGNQFVDTEYIAAGVRDITGMYLFSQDSTINLTSGGAAVKGFGDEEDLGEFIAIAANKSLTMNISGGNEAYGLVQSGSNGIIAVADQMTINATGTDKAYGVLNTAGTDMSLSTNKGLNINVKGNDAVAIKSNGLMDITGDVTVNSSKDGIYYNGNNKDKYFKLVGNYTQENIKNGGIGIRSEGAGNVEIHGNVTMNAEDGAYLITSSGTNSKVYLTSGTEDVVNYPNYVTKITGDVKATDNGEITLGLTHKESMFTGNIITESNGKVNMNLANGGTWNNIGTENNDGNVIEKLEGGKNMSYRGVILQNDKDNLTINNYSGSTMVIYQHTGDGTKDEDYSAGDLIIKSADKYAGRNSKIVLSTSSTGIDMQNADAVKSALNTLAGKLYYEAYATKDQRNLEGNVQIADGLTSSSQSLAIGDIKFDSATGQGSAVDAEIVPEEQTKVDFTSQITGDKDIDIEYVHAGVLKEDGIYKFTKNSNITIKGTAGAAIQTQYDMNADFGAPTKYLNIDAAGSILNLDVDAGKTNQGISAGIDNHSNNTVNITAKELNIKAFNATNSGAAYGIQQGAGGDDTLTINAENVNIDVESKTAVGIRSRGITTINGNLNVKAHGWINGRNNSYGIFVLQNGNVTVNGDATFSGYGYGLGIQEDAMGAQINLNNGNITMTPGEDSLLAIMGVGDGTININMNDEINNTNGNTVKIEGDIYTTKSTINLGLSGKDSSYIGKLIDDSIVGSSGEGTGKINVYLNNGAQLHNLYQDGQFGATIEKLVGGKDIAHAGYIIQKDTAKLNIHNFSGAAIVAYEHENQGFDVTDYKGGNTVVQNAAAGSTIRLATDGTNINRDSSEEVNKVLTALAQKLEYQGAATEGNLKAEVSIADGLTASSNSLVGNIKFDENGNGSFDIDNGYHTDNTVPGGDGGQGGDGDCDCKPTVGDYETDMMKGARSAMMTSMMAWRDTAADVYTRGAAIQDGAEAGTWARAYGGKMKYDGSNTSFENSYWAAQVGYDKVLENGWTIGAAIDYMDGNASYMNGDGDNSMYSLGLYGSKDLGNNQYLDLTAKVGQVENEFTARNIIGQELKGDYKATAYSLSAQYSKRYGEKESGYFEPQLQLTWAHVDGKDYNAYCGNSVLNIDQDAFDSLVGRVGFKAGVENEKGEFYAKLSLAHEFAGDLDTRYDANDGGAKATSYDMGDTWSEFTLGGSYNLSKTSNFYADITRSLTGDYQHQWKLNAGINFTF